jgi:hypothetical protein
MSLSEFISAIIFSTNKFVLCFIIIKNKLERSGIKGKEIVLENNYTIFGFKPRSNSHSEESHIVEAK